jgi:hypothetical protein
MSCVQTIENVKYNCKVINYQPWINHFKTNVVCVCVCVSEKFIYIQCTPISERALLFGRFPGFARYVLLVRVICS